MLSFQKPLVAVVDDDDSARVLCRAFLKRLGCAVQVFVSGEEFLANASRTTTDCVFMDELFVGLQGHQTFHAMRRGGWCIPVISGGDYIRIQLQSGTYQATLLNSGGEQILELYGNGQIAHVHDFFMDSMTVNGPRKFEDAIRKALQAAGYCLPPKRILVLDPDLLTWNGGTILGLAHSISEERAFHYLPILGDALEEAGCTNADVLNHCRQPGEHWQGCWVLDGILAPPFDASGVIVCRSCKQKLRVPNHLGELTVRCPRCKQCFDWDTYPSPWFLG